MRHLPTSRQCFSIRRERATFSPTSVQAGEVSWIFARSALTLSTRPPVEVDPMLINNSSFLTSLETFVCFLSSVLTPSRRRSRKRLISNSTLQCGRYQSDEEYWPIRPYQCKSWVVCRQRPILDQLNDQLCTMSDRSVFQHQSIRQEPQMTASYFQRGETWFCWRLVDICYDPHCLSWQSQAVSLLLVRLGGHL